MRINNIDTLEYGATLLEREIENAEIINYDDWLDDGFSPITHKQVFKFIMVKCSFLIEQNTDDLAEEAISKLISLSAQAELKFDDLSKTYKGIIEEISKEKITTGKYDLIIHWKCEYAFGNEIEVMIDSLNTKIDMPGTVKTPVTIEIDPTINLIDLNISGLEEDIKISNLTAGNTITINSEIGEVTENGVNKYQDYDSWSFPYLVPGENTIAIDDDSVDMKIRYKPRWL